MENRIILVLLTLGLVLHFTCGQLQQYHRETLSSKNSRLQRQIPIGAYPISFNQENAAAAVEDGNQAAQNTQLFLQHLKGPQSPFQQIQYVQQSPQQQVVHTQQSEQVQPLRQYISAQNGAIFVDQYGRLVQVSQPMQSQQSPTQTVSTASQTNNVLRLVDQYGNVVGQLPGPQVQQVAYQQLYAQSPVFHQVIQSAPVVHHHEVVQPAPVFHQVVQQAPVYQQVIQPPPVLHHQVVQPAPVYHEVAAPQPVYHQVLAPAPPAQVLHHHIAAPPAPVVHETVYPSQFEQIEHQPLKPFISQPQPFLHFQEIVQPIVVPEVAPSKLYLPAPPPVVPVVHKKIIKEVEVAPELHIIKQPILPPAVFQKQIFALKNPPIRVLTYSDLCTVYPYQRKLKACVIKKGQLPELHHPDIQLVSEQTQYTPTPTVLKPMKPTKTSEISPDNENIQDILRKGKEGFLPFDPSEENSPTAENNDDEESTKVENINAASSNKKEQQVKKLRALRRTTTTRTTTMRTTKRTTTTETPTEDTTTTTKKPKRRSTKGRSRRNRKNKTSTSTTEKPFTLT